MISRIGIKNFKGVSELSLDFDRFSLVQRESGWGKTSVFDALMMLHMFSCGADASVAKYAWWSSRVPTEIEIHLSDETFGNLRYAIQVVQDGIFTRVVGETIEHNGIQSLIREGDHYQYMNSPPFQISNSGFALPIIVTSSFGDATQNLRHVLQSLWLLSPAPDAMLSNVGAPLPTIDIQCSRLARYIVDHQREQPMLYGLLMAYLRDLDLDVAALNVQEDNFGIPYLSYRKKSFALGRYLPFESLSQTEKILFLVCFIRAVNEHIRPITCVWDNPFNWLGDAHAERVRGVLEKSFSKQGQALLFSSKRKSIEEAYDSAALH